MARKRSKKEPLKITLNDKSYEIDEWSLEAKKGKFILSFTLETTVIADAMLKRDE